MGEKPGVELHRLHPTFAPRLRGRKAGRAGTKSSRDPMTFQTPRGVPLTVRTIWQIDNGRRAPSQRLLRAR